MSDSPQTREEEVPLTIISGTGDIENNDTCDQVVIDGTGQDAAPDAAPFCNDKHHRKLAICSIICGISCIGIKALIYSVKAETSKKQEDTAKFSQKARKFGIISIVTWVSILALTPMLMGLISYLLTLQD